MSYYLDDLDEGYDFDVMGGYHQFCLEQGYSPFDDDPELFAAYLRLCTGNFFEYGTGLPLPGEADSDDWSTYSDDWDTYSEILGGDEMPAEKQILGKYVSIDCELTGAANEAGQSSAVAIVSIVNWHGHCLYDKIIMPEEKDNDLRKQFAQFVPNYFDEASSFDVVRKKVAEFIKGRILVGFNLREKLEALQIVHDEKNLRDVALWQPYRDKSSPSSPLLQQLAEDELGIKIEDPEETGDATKGAHVAMSLYRKVHKEWH